MYLKVLLYFCNIVIELTIKIFLFLICHMKIRDQQKLANLFHYDSDKKMNKLENTVHIQISLQNNGFCIIRQPKCIILNAYYCPTFIWSECIV
jgi:hypothetical protein